MPFVDLNVFTVAGKELAAEHHTCIGTSLSKGAVVEVLELALGSLAITSPISEEATEAPVWRWYCGWGEFETGGQPSLGRVLSAPLSQQTATGVGLFRISVDCQSTNDLGRPKVNTFNNCLHILRPA